MFRPSIRSAVAGLPFAVLLLTALVATAQERPSTPARGLEVIYLANEGFLLRSANHAVLIDALFGEGISGYPSVTPAERRSLEAGKPPYNGIDLVLASHVHRDHFNAAAVARFLVRNPQTRFVSTEQAVASLLAIDGSAQFAGRVFGYWPPEGSAERLDLGDLQLTVFNLHHGRGGQITENLGLLLEICGTTVLHVGDTEANADDMRAAGLVGVNPDIALLPSWLLRPGRWTGATESVLRPDSIVAMHLPRRDASSSYFYGGARNLDELIALIESRFPDAWIPTATGTSRTFICRADRD